MTNIFYFFGLISIFVSIYWIVKNWNETQEITIDINFKELKSIVKGLSKHWDFFFHIGYIVWIVAGLFSSQLFLFSMLVIITFVVPNFFKKMPHNVVEANEMLNVLIMILILLHHYR